MRRATIILKPILTPKCINRSNQSIQKMMGDLEKGQQKEDKPVNIKEKIEKLSKRMKKSDDHEFIKLVNQHYKFEEYDKLRKLWLSFMTFNEKNPQLNPTWSINIWNKILRSLTSRKEVAKTFALMKKYNVKPNTITLNNLLQVLGRGNVNIMKSIMKYAQAKNIPLNIVSYNCVLDSFAKKDQLVEALDLYKKLIELNVRPNHRTFDIIINSIAKVSPEDVLTFYSKIKDQELEVDTYLTAMRASLKVDPKITLDIYRDTTEKNIPKVTETYNLILTALSMLDNNNGALDICQDLIDKGLADMQTKVIAANILEKEKQYSLVLELVRDIRKDLNEYYKGEPMHPILRNIEVRALAKVGLFKEAFNLWKEMKTEDINLIEESTTNVLKENFSKVVVKREEW